MMRCAAVGLRALYPTEDAPKERPARRGEAYLQSTIILHDSCLLHQVQYGLHDSEAAHVCADTYSTVRVLYYCCTINVIP